MKVIKTHEITPESLALMNATEKHWVYNGLDCCVTAEVLHAIKPQLDNQTRATYEFSKSLQAPILEMRIRGILVDQGERDRVVKIYSAQVTQLEAQLNRILLDGLGLELNWRSPIQLKKLFYEILKLPPIKKRNSKGLHTPTVDRGALEQLDNYFYARPIVSHILGLRDIAKKIGVLKTSIDSDTRMRTSFNIAGTTTGRISSSLSDFGTGTNLQNIEQKLRRPFVADPKMKFAYIDLEQAESRAVGAIEWNLFHDGRYLDACESGDLHTSVCRLAWTDLKWSSPIDLKADRAIAEQPYYRQHTYRHMAKVLGHGTNYAGKPFTMAKHTKLEASLISTFQFKYFAAFPSHQRWHAWTASELLQTGNLTTLTGRRRWFMGRRNDDTTVREAIAYVPQGSVGDILNLGMLKVWRLGICQLLLQIHDAILIQYPEDREDEILPVVVREIQIPIDLLHGRTLLIPSEAKSGWNWAEQDANNPDGLKKYKGHDDRVRQSHPTQALSKLDRLLHGVL